MTKEIPTIKTDFLVIGSGVAGISSAIVLAESGANVLLPSKGPMQESSSGYAQGGVAVALAKQDSSYLHFMDTVLAGKQIGNQEAINILVNEGKARIEDLINWGASFDREGDGFALALESAHSRNRILRAMGDSTGKEIISTLTRKAGTIKNIKNRANAFITDLIMQDGRCVGAVCLDELTGQMSTVMAKGVILASGGAGQIYYKTTNPKVATGDGYAIAYRAGANIDNMEFVQFHPTTLFINQDTQFLISEAVRGEGGILKNADGVPFMAEYEPDAEMATRDRVTMAIYKEMCKTGTDYVFLDITHIDSGFIKKRFPGIYSNCLRYNIDITKEMIPVSPSSHFIMGGVVSSTDGMTSIPGLYAAGEVACTGVHGANRLASNSLLEGLVFGVRAGKAAAVQCADNLLLPPEKTMVERLLFPPTPSLTSDQLYALINRLKKLMWNKVGIVRNGNKLAEAIQEISELEKEIVSASMTRLGFEVKNMITTAKLISSASLAREASIGAHFREDSKVIV